MGAHWVLFALRVFGGPRGSMRLHASPLRPLGLRGVLIGLIGPGGVRETPEPGCPWVSVEGPFAAWELLGVG